MHKEEIHNITTEIIARAKANEHTPFEYIRNWTDYRKCQLSRAALKLLIKSLTYSTDSMLNKYCKAIITGTADVSQLLVRGVLNQTVEFYKKELAMADDMLDEYRAYLSDGHLINAFLFNEYRSWSDCWDRRNLE